MKACAVRRTAALVLVFAFAGAGCTGTPRSASPARAADYPGELVDSAALPSLFLRQRIEARFGDRSIAFSAVLQSDAGVLSLLALTPYGSRAFLLQQRGKTIAFNRYVDRDLPFPPRFILLDVHRTLFLGLPGAPLPDGDHTAVQHGERIVERWRGGRLLERTFERVDGRPAGRIRIAYQDGMRPPLPPARIDLHNGWFGYQLAIHTLADE
jgi:hypothetical protein